MTAADLALIAVINTALVLSVVAGLAIAALRSATRALEAETERLRHEVQPLVAEAAEVAAAAEETAARIERLLTDAEGVVERVDVASELAYETFTRPVIKAMAVGAGTRQAVKRLRSRSDGDPA